MCCLMLEQCSWDRGLSYNHGFINKWMLARGKPVWHEKTRLVSPDVQAAVTYRLNVIQAEPPVLLLDQEDKRRLAHGLSFYVPICLKIHPGAQGILLCSLNFSYLVFLITGTICCPWLWIIFFLEYYGSLL